MRLKHCVSRFAAAILAAFFVVDSSAQPFGNFAPADTTRISFGTFPGAVQANGPSGNSQMTRDGRFVVFESTATNLFSGVTVTPGRRHVYLLDRQANSLELVSLNRSGFEAAGESYSPTVSADGRYVAFVSDAHGSEFFSICLCSELCHVNVFVPGTHIFVRDRLANRTFLASQISQLVEVQAGVCENTPPQTSKKCISVGCNLNNPAEYTLEPVMTRKERRVSAAVLNYNGVPAPNSQNPRISGNGQFVVFDTNASNLGGAIEPYSFLAPTLDTGSCPSCDYTNSSTNPNGGIIRTARGFPLIGSAIDSNSVRDVVVRDGQDPYSTRIVSFACALHATGGCGVLGQLDSVKPQISDDGKFVSFQTAWNFLDLDFNGLTDIFLVERNQINGEVSKLDRISNNTSRLLAANGESVNSAMSADGRYIAFESAASNLITGDTNGLRDVFVHDRKFFVTVRCGTTAAPQGDGASGVPSLSGSGDYIGFQSAARNWGPTSGFNNIFAGRLNRDSIGRLSSCTVGLASLGDAGAGGNNGVTQVSMGTVPRTSATPGAPRVQIPAIAYQSVATNLHSGAADTNGFSDVFQAPGCSGTDQVTDTDGDGTVDCFDQCRIDPIKVTDADTDADGYPDCEDGCAADPQKAVPGFCGCGAVDNDSDSDGNADCKDKCPNDPAKTDPGTCGCGQVDVDANGNGVIDCVESQAPGATPTPGGVPTATPIPTATPVPALPNIDPGTVTLRRGNATTLTYTLSPIDIGPLFARYELLLEKTVGRTVSQRRIVTTKVAGTIKGLEKAKYRLAFRIVGTNGEKSRNSAYSSPIQIRQSSR